MTTLRGACSTLSLSLSHARSPQLSLLVTRSASGSVALASVRESSRRLAERATLAALRALANAAMGHAAAARRAWSVLGGAEGRAGSAWISLEAWLHSLAGSRAAVAAAAAVVDACAAARSGSGCAGEGGSEGTGGGGGEDESESTCAGGPRPLLLDAPGLCRVLLHRLVPERGLQFRQVGGERDGELASAADVAAATGAGAGVAATRAAAAVMERSRNDAEAAADPAADPARQWLLLPLLRCWCAGQWAALWAQQGSSEGSVTHEQFLLACATEEAVRDWRDANPRALPNGQLPLAPLSAASLHAVAATAASLLTGPCLPADDARGTGSDAAVLGAVQTRFAAEAACSLASAVADACECVCSAAAAAPAREDERGSGASCALPAAAVDSALLDTPCFHAACAFLHAWRPNAEEPVGDRLSRVPAVPTLLSAALRCVANACFRRPRAQHVLLLHDGRGIAAVLSYCRVDDRVPLLREWALLAIRNACEGCEEVQRFVEQLAPRAVAPTTALQHTDMRLELDSDGKPRIQRATDG